MARLPTPGSDSGTWGTILNDFLLQALKPDGTIQDNVVTSSALAPNSVTNAALASNAVTAAIIQDGTITEALLDTALQAKVNASQAGLDAKLDKVAVTNQVYVTDGSGNQSTRGFSVNLTANSIAQRSTGGVLMVGTPTADGHATTKTYVDTADAGKVDKTATANRVYVTDNTGQQTAALFSSSASNNSMMYRNGSGYASVVTPIDPGHIANKSYVDSAVVGMVKGSANGTQTSLTLWTGTQAQYDALSTHDPQTIYVVTA